MVNNWGSGWQVEVVVTNYRNSTVNGWEVAITHPSAPRRTGGWNAEFSESGNVVRAGDVHYNKQLRSEQSTSFGYQGSGTGMPASGNPLPCAGS